MLRSVLLCQQMIKIAGGSIERVGFDPEVLEHGGEEIVQWGLGSVMLDGVVVAFVLQPSTGEDDGEVSVRVAGCVTNTTAEEDRGVIKESASAESLPKMMCAAPHL